MKSIFLALTLSLSVVAANADDAKHAMLICQGDKLSLKRFNQPVITFSFFGGEEPDIRNSYTKALNEIKDTLAPIGIQLNITDDKNTNADIEFHIKIIGQGNEDQRRVYNPEIERNADGSTKKAVYKMEVMDNWDFPEEAYKRFALHQILPLLGTNQHFDENRSDTIWSRQKQGSVSLRDLPYGLTELDKRIIRFLYSMPIKTPPWKVPTLAKKEFSDSPESSGQAPWDKLKKK